jgi:sulfide:quinone oxidoreductase
VPVSDGRPQTLIVGGGIAGLEALMALADLGTERTELTLIAPDPDFHLKPLVVEEPFTSQPAPRRELEPLVSALGAKLVRAAVVEVNPATRTVELSDQTRLRYDFLVVCVGGRSRAVYADATTLRAAGETIEIEALLAKAAKHESRRLALVVPPGVTWPLPLYEIALMSRRRADELGYRDLRITLYTPEIAPLVIFGTSPSAAIAELLDARRVEFRSDSSVREDEGGGFFISPGDLPLEAGAMIALPVLEGPMVTGLPPDEAGFIPIDEHARVPGLEDVYAAGDGTTFPVKQGGLGTQQADAAAEHIAAKLGAPGEPQPFHPVLRGQLILGGESLNLRHDLTGGHGEGVAASDYLWWPPHKVSGRYLAAWLAHEEAHLDPTPPSRPLEVEVALPHEWHEQPIGFDTGDPVDVD